MGARGWLGGSDPDSVALLSSRPGGLAARHTRAAENAFSSNTSWDPNKMPQPGCLRNNTHLFLTPLGAQRLKSRGQPVRFLVGALFRV